MKSCSECGLFWPDDVVQCSTCKHPTKFHSTTLDASATSDNSTTLTAYQGFKLVRPDGSTPRMMGWILIVIGVLLAVWSGLMPATTYSFSTDLDAGKIARKALLAICAEGAFGLGLVLWLAGYIVHAISFLPSKEDVLAKD